MMCNACGQLRERGCKIHRFGEIFLVREDNYVVGPRGTTCLYEFVDLIIVDGLFFYLLRACAKEV